MQKFLRRCKLPPKWVYPGATPIRGIIWKRRNTCSSESRRPSGHTNSSYFSAVVLCALGLECAATRVWMGKLLGWSSVAQPRSGALSRHSQGWTSLFFLVLLFLVRMPPWQEHSFPQRGCLRRGRAGAWPHSGIWCLLNRSRGREGWSCQGSAFPQNLAGSCHPEPFPCHCPGYRTNHIPIPRSLVHEGTIQVSSFEWCLPIIQHQSVFALPRPSVSQAALPLSSLLAKIQTSCRHPEVETWIFPELRGASKEHGSCFMENSIKKLLLLLLSLETRGGKTPAKPKK